MSKKRTTVADLASRLDAAEHELGRLRHRDRFHHGQDAVAESYSPNPDDSSACPHCGMTAGVGHRDGCPISVRQGGPHRAVVVDATQWQGDASHERKALIGLLTAIVSEGGEGMLEHLNGCGLRDQETGMGPVDFARAVLGGDALPPPKGDKQ